MTVNPSTPVETLSEIAPYVDLVLIMSVNPGLRRSELHPVEQRQAAARAPPPRPKPARPGTELEVDGGIDANTAKHAVRAGASVLVAGNAVFRHPEGVAAAVRALRDAAKLGAPGTRIA